MADPWLDSLTGQGPRQPPHVGPLGPPSAGRQFGNWLERLGMMPSQADAWGTAASLSPFGQAYDAGGNLGRAWAEGSPGMGLAGALQLGMAALPGIRPRWAPPTGRVTPDALEDTLRQMGAGNLQRYTAPGGSTYLEFSNPLERTGARITARVPQDFHAGNPRGHEIPGNYFDLAGGRPRRRLGGNPTINEGGGRFTDWENMLPALRWRMSRDPGGGNWLVREDQVPRGLRHGPQPEPPAPPPAPDPRQLKLLGSTGALGLGSQPRQRPQDDKLEPYRRGVRASISISGG